MREGHLFSVRILERNVFSFFSPMELPIYHHLEVNFPYFFCCSSAFWRSDGLIREHLYFRPLQTILSMRVQHYHPHLFLFRLWDSFCNASHAMFSLFFNILPNIDCEIFSLLAASRRPIFGRWSYFSKMSSLSLKLRARRVRLVLMLKTKKDGVETLMTTDCTLYDYTVTATITICILTITIS